MSASLHPRQPWRSFWFGRFEVGKAEDGLHQIRDWLLPAPCKVAVDLVPAGDERLRDVAFFRHGFVRPAWTSFPLPVRPAPRDANDLLFWQFPCRTEAAAFNAHARLARAGASPGALHCYLGLPWATWLDKQRVDTEQKQVTQTLQIVGVRLSGLRHALAALGIELRVHTVCQHVRARDLFGLWRRIGVTDLWWSHATDNEVASSEVSDLHIHPWSLYAVNVEDPQRRDGLTPGKDPAERQTLASFVGVHLDHYLSDVRLRLRRFAEEPGFCIRVREDRWHFEDVVYGHQVKGEALVQAYQIDASVSDYNRLLSDSTFALCPAGAGPNSLRLWEALATGAVPVLLGPPPALPAGGSLPAIDWDAIVLKVPDDAVEDLPRLLRALPIDEVRRRQRQGLQAYRLVKSQCCF
ncbi:MAG: glycosyltransferase family 47 protein [Burkholderiaceae bacterium]|nr:glycosyltransferase family 47 protein [Burkholderiaceae bacterium]